MENETFTYRFDLDRDYFIKYSMEHQSMLPFITLVIIRPFIFLILMKKRDSMTADIRWGYIINQIAMIAQEFNFCFLFRIHDLAPYSGLYCDGPLCRMGISKQHLMMMLAITTIGPVPTFLLILVRMHQRIIENSDSHFKLSRRSQAALLFCMTAILVVNVPGFYHFGRYCKNADEMMEVADLLWLKRRGGTLFLFGPPGESQYFGKELLILLCSMLTIVPFILVVTFHSMKIMYEQKPMIFTFERRRKSLTTRTQRLQFRIAAVFFVQLVAICGFYVLPLASMLLHMVIDISCLPVWFIVISRWGLIIAFTLESTILSLIFLLKNPVHRQIIKDVFRQFKQFCGFGSSLYAVESTRRPS